MASIKVILRTNKKNEEGKHPLAIQIIKDRYPSIIHLGYYLEESEWDKKERRVKKCHANHARLNNLIAQKLAEANAKALDLVAQGHYTSRAVKHKIKPTAGLTFFAQAKIHLDSLKSLGKYNQYVSDSPRVERFREFLKSSDIGFSDITVALLKRYRVYLKTTRNVSERTIINHLIIIRTILNQAIKSKMADNKNYPFGKDAISIKFPDSLKIGLSAEEVKAIEGLDLTNEPKQDHARNVWLVSYYFAGARTGDVLLLKRTDFQNNRLFYTMNKNDKGGSLKVTDKALAIIEKYKALQCKNGLLFPDLECVDDLNDMYLVQRKTAYADKKLNTHLTKVAEKAGIDKKLKMHIARHTFGNISGDRIPIQMLQKLYRHSHITTTIGYQSNFIHQDADEALEAVVGG